MGEWLAFTFALSGRRFAFYVTQGVALGLELAGLSARAWPPQYSPPPHFASKVSYSASPQTSAKCPRGAPCSDAATAMFGKKKEIAFGNFGFPNAISFGDVVGMRAWHYFFFFRPNEKPNERRSL